MRRRGKRLIRGCVSSSPPLDEENESLWSSDLVLYFLLPLPFVPSSLVPHDLLDLLSFFPPMLLHTQRQTDRQERERRDGQAGGNECMDEDGRQRL